MQRSYLYTAPRLPSQRWGYSQGEGCLQPLGGAVTLTTQLQLLYNLRCSSFLLLLSAFITVCEAEIDHGGTHTHTHTNHLHTRTEGTFRVSWISRLLDTFLTIQLIPIYHLKRKIKINLKSVFNHKNPPLSEIGVEAEPTLTAGLLAISLVCLNISLTITLQLLEFVRAYCLKLQPQMI